MRYSKVPDRCAWPKAQPPKGASHERIDWFPRAGGELLREPDVPVDPESARAQGEIGNPGRLHR
jgi:hypothetical protein